MDTQHGNQDDLLDALVAEYSDRVEAGERPSHAEFLARAQAQARPGLERCLKVIDAGRDTVGRAMVAPGQRLGRFRIQREIGRGGMAIVYLADDPELRRSVALKVLRPGLALEESHVDRFRREGRAMARLAHPGVVQVFEVGSDTGVHWIAMEYVAGPSLASIVEALHAEGRPTAELLGRLTGDAQYASFPSLEAAAAELLLGPAEGLAAAHEAGLIHRDIKPSNILVHPGGRAVLADFGLARAEGDPGLSLTGEPIGTPHYMAPEQADAAVVEIDGRADVYGLGVVLYELISGRRPFEGTTVLEVLDAIRFQRPVPLRQQVKSATRDAEAVVTRAIEREAEERYESVQRFAADLSRLATGQETEARHHIGGALRRGWSGLKAVLTGRAVEFKTATTFLGLPLLHVVGNPMATQPRRDFSSFGPVAKGWFAAGPRAAGVFACGALSAGLVSIGGLSFGLLLALGGLASGGLTLGGVSVGARAFGGVAVGDIAAGGIAIGRGAIGGLPIGKYVVIDREEALAEHRSYVRGEVNPIVYDFFASEPFPLNQVYLMMPGLDEPPPGR